MPTSTIYAAMKAIALNDYSDLVISAQVLALPTGDPHKLRLAIVDGSLLDIFISVSGRYSFHWDRRLTASGDLYCHDNAPHDKWRHVPTFPKHFHDGDETTVTASQISDDPTKAVREFLSFVRHKLLSTS